MAGGTCCGDEVVVGRVADEEGIFKCPTHHRSRMKCRDAPVLSTAVPRWIRKRRCMCTDLGPAETPLVKSSSPVHPPPPGNGRQALHVQQGSHASVKGARKKIHIPTKVSASSPNQGTRYSPNASSGSGRLSAKLRVHSAMETLRRG